MESTKPERKKPVLMQGQNEEIKEEDEGKEGSDSEETKEAQNKLSEQLSSPLSNDSAFGSNKGEDDQEENDEAWPTLDEALAKDFDINEVSTIKQRFNDVQRQPRKKSDLFPYKLQLLTKRVKRCKKCEKKIVVPNINMSQQKKLRVNLQMNLHIPKVTIYRMSKYEPEKSRNHIDLMLQFRNPNESTASISFEPLTFEQLEEQSDKIIVQTRMPVG